MHSKVNFLVAKPFFDRQVKHDRSDPRSTRSYLYGRNEVQTEDWYTDRMTTVQVPTRFDEAQLVLLDQLVTEGLADSRSELIRFAVDQLHSAHRRRRTGQTIADAYREMPQTGAEDTWAMANAIALTEAEPW